MPKLDIYSTQIEPEKRRPKMNSFSSPQNKAQETSEVDSYWMICVIWMQVEKVEKDYYVYMADI